MTKSKTTQQRKNGGFSLWCWLFKCKLTLKRRNYSKKLGGYSPTYWLTSKCKRCGFVYFRNKYKTNYD